jgi:hypothetical protein
MPKKTLYVREEDIEVWEQAQSLAGGDESLSSIVIEALRRYLRIRGGQPSEIEGMKRIVVETYDQDERLIRKAFVGKWLVEAMQTEANRYRWSIAQTQKGSIVVYCFKGELPRDECITDFKVYDSFDELEQDVPDDVLAAVAVELGEDFVQDLDI